MGLFDVFRSVGGSVLGGIGDFFGGAASVLGSVVQPLIGGIQGGFAPGPVGQIQGPSRGGVGGFLEGFGGLIGEAAEQFLSGGRDPIDFPSPTAPRAPGAATDPRRFPGDPTLATILAGAPGGGIGGDIIGRAGFDPRFSTAGVLPVALPLALPGGAAILRQLPGIFGGILGGAAGSQFFGGESAVELPFGGAIFRPTPSGVRARSLVEVVNPMTGRKVWYRNVGRPILFSGDLTVCKRVERVAKRARRGSRGR